MGLKQSAHFSHKVYLNNEKSHAIVRLSEEKIFEAVRWTINFFGICNEAVSKYTGRDDRHSFRRKKCYGKWLLRWFEDVIASC